MKSTRRTNNNNIIQSPEVICPICKEPCYLDINNYKISLYGCKQGHKQDNLNLNEFLNSQKIYLTQIICGNFINVVNAI